MDIGYLYNFNSYPPYMGRSVHVNQILTGLMQGGNNLHVFDLEKMPGTKKYPKTEEGLKSLFGNIDVLYIRLNGDHFECDLSLEKLIPENLPVVLEINSPLSEYKAYFRDMKSVTNLNIRTRLRIRNLENRRRKFAKTASAAICVSREMENYAREFLKIKKTFVITNGSDPGIFSPDKRDEKLFAFPEGDFKVLWMGNMELPWHEGMLAKNVAEKMCFSDKTFRFIFLTKTKFINFKMPDNVVVIDEVSYDEVPKYISSVDACLCLYTMKPWCEWGFYLSPLKLFDYMACARPVIATNIGQAKEIIKNNINGFLVDNDVEDIIEKLIFLKKNKEKADKMGKRARENVLKLYNWSRVVKETEKILKEI